MEHKKNYPWITPVGVLLITIFVVACSPRTIPPTEPQPTETAQATATMEGNTPVAEQDLCTSAYYPVRQGATWSYKSTGGPAGEYSFTDTITSVGDDGFTLSTQIGDLTRTQEWTCTAEGFTALQLGGAPAALLNSQDIQMSLDVTNASGVALPNQINPGDQWLHTADVQGHVTFMNEEAEAAGSVLMNFTAGGNESVTVPAGSFEALRVDVDVTLNVNATYEGLTLPVSFSADYTYWFAPGVGWVKASGTGSVLGSSFTETTELQSYNIP